MGQAAEDASLHGVVLRGRLRGCRQVYGSFEYRETWGTWLGRHWPLLGCTPAGGDAAVSG